MITGDVTEFGCKEVGDHQRWGILGRGNPAMRLAYALILLREQGVPCVFYPDLYGASYKDRGGDGNEYQIDMPVIPELEKLIQVRQRFANGVQTDYFNDRNCVVFSRSGTADAPGCVVVLTKGAESGKAVSLGAELAHRIWRDLLGNRLDEITTDERNGGTSLFR